MFSQGRRLMEALANSQQSSTSNATRLHQEQQRPEQAKQNDVEKRQVKQKDVEKRQVKQKDVEKQKPKKVEHTAVKEQKPKKVEQNGVKKQQPKKVEQNGVQKQQPNQDKQHVVENPVIDSDDDSEYSPSECEVLNPEWPSHQSLSQTENETTPGNDNETHGGGWSTSDHRVEDDFPTAPAPIAVRQDVTSNHTPDDQNTTNKVPHCNIRKQLFPGSQTNEFGTFSVMPLEISTYQSLMPVLFDNGISLGQANQENTTVNPLNPVASLHLSSTLDEMFDFDTEAEVLTVSHDAPHEADEEVVGHDPVVAEEVTLPGVDMNVAPLEERNVQVASTPKKRKRIASANNGSPTRKRVKNPNGWKVNQAKLAYNAGLAHTTSQGKERKEREMKEGCSAKCRRKCQERITYNRRKKIFETYYSSASKQAQWLMLGKMAKQVPIKRRTLPGGSSPHRKFSYNYYLTDDDGNQVPVCQTMFLATFDISITVVQNALKKNSPDKRGKQTVNRPTRISQDLKMSVINHIKSFPKIESHYCRESTTRQYLQENLSISKMYRMYLTERGKEPHTATYRQYREIFNHCFNLDFYQPKKDQCSLCAKWKSLPTDVQEGDSEIVQEYHEHVAAKELARSYKQKSKDLSRSEENKDGKIKVICFDLQKVFFCPKTEVGDFFYKSKVACYNLTIFDCTLKKATCYVWDQTIGGRGSAEIASCVLKYIEQEVNNGVKEFHCYSDSCWSQNKNQFLYTMYYAATHKYNIKIIHRYLEKGHTQMECDSVHASIEKKIKNNDIFTPMEWYGYIRSAKVNKPQYTVVQMKQEDIVSFVDLSEEHFAWSKVSVSKIHQITIDSETPGTITYKFQLGDEEKQFAVLLKKPGRPIAWNSFKPPQAYSAPIAPRPKLLKDLKWMLGKNLIPDRAVEFYKTIISPNFGMAIITEGQKPDEDDIPALVAHDARRLDSLLESNNEENVDNPDREL